MSGVSVAAGAGKGRRRLHREIPWRSAALSGRASGLKCTRRRPPGRRRFGMAVVFYR